MKDKNIQNELSTPDSGIENTTVTDPDEPALQHETGDEAITKTTDKTDKFTPAESANPDVASDQQDKPNQPVPVMKAGTGAGMSDAVMPNSIDASDSDAINSNIEALASGRMNLHVGS